MEKIIELQKTNQDTIDKVNTTLESIIQSLASIKELDKRFDDFKSSFSDLIGQFAEKIIIGNTFNNPNYQEEFGKAKLSNVKEITEIIKKSKNICILTGAGISAASGISTFRSGDSTLNKEFFGEMKPEDAITYRNYSSNVEQFWERYSKMRNHFCSKLPNINHEKIAQLNQLFVKNKKGFTLITQNIDDLHKKAILKIDKLNNLGKFFYEIHGNLKYKRCEDLCKPILQKWSPIKNQVPVCDVCKKVARPHVLFFDETYENILYKSDEAKERARNSDLLVVIGTSLKTNLACRIVDEFVKGKKIVIEINPEQSISTGKCYFLQGKCEEYISAIVNKL